MLNEATKPHPPTQISSPHHAVHKMRPVRNEYQKREKDGDMLKKALVAVRLEHQDPKVRHKIFHTRLTLERHFVLNHASSIADRIQSQDAVFWSHRKIALIRGNRDVPNSSADAALRCLIKWRTNKRMPNAKGHFKLKANEVSKALLCRHTSILWVSTSHSSKAPSRLAQNKRCEENASVRIPLTWGVWIT